MHALKNVQSASLCSKAAVICDLGLALACREAGGGGRVHRGELPGEGGHAGVAFLAGGRTVMVNALLRGGPRQR